MRVALAAALIAAVGGWMVTPPAAQGQDDPGTVELFAPVSGRLDEDNPSQDWTYEARTGEAISVIVRGTSGGLDPILTVLDAGGETLAENDDLDSLVVDAGIEALIVDEAGPVTLRVSRYEETSGEYELVVTRGFADVIERTSFDAETSRWEDRQSALATLDNGRLQLRMNPAGVSGITFASDGEPLDDFYYEARFLPHDASPYALFGLVFRAQPGGEHYRFLADTDGRWSAVMQDRSGEYVMGSWSADDVPAASGWTLGVLARGSTLMFYGNGALLGTVTDERLPAQGRIGLMIASDPDQAGPAIVQVGELLVTARLGTTYAGMPLALQSWNSLDPQQIAGELVEAGQVTLDGPRDLFVPDANLRADTRTFQTELLGSEQAAYSDYLLGASVVILTGGESPGCGVISRWADERSFDVAYLDAAGGFGLSQVRDDELVTNVYDMTEMVQAQGANTLLVVAQGTNLALYINGALVAQETALAGEGRVGLALLNYEDAATQCVFGNVWVWPLSAPGDE